MGKIIFNDVTYTGGGALPDGGDAGDILAKKSNDDGDAEWVKPPASIDAYTKAETDALLDEKADKATTYTQEQTDALLDEKAALTVRKISTAGGGDEVHATVVQGQDEVDLNYYKRGETPDYINLNINEDSFRFKTAAAVDASVPFIATYESTTYEDVKAAIDANRAIVVDFPNNNNIICVTFATYTSGQNIVMSGIYKFGNDIFVTGMTLTPANAWSISNSGMYDKAEVDALIPDVSDFATQQDLADGLALKADAADTYTKSEVDALIPDVSDFATEQELTDGLALKADAATTYTKTEVDALIPDVTDFVTEADMQTALADKADKADVYTKTETDGLLDDKADTATTYTKTEVDALLPDMTDYYDKTETDALLADKADAADLADYYTKTQADALLDDKADASAVYTKGETDTLLADKADADSVYDKTETDALLAAKADASAVYTKTEADALLADKADSADFDDYYTKTAADALLDEKADKSTTYTKTETDALLDEKASKSSVPEVTVSIPTSGGASSFVGNTRQDGTKNGIEITETAQTLQFEFKRYSDAGRFVVVPNQFALMSKADVSALAATDNKIGNLGNLQTTDKTNLVAAVNEVNGKAGVHFEVDAEKWYGTYKDENGVTYQVYTKTVYIPALPATAGITTYQHGISGIKQILSAYGFTTDGFVLNAPRQTAADNIAIYQVQKSATGGIAIEVGKDRSSKSAYVTLIYAKNN